MRAKQAEGAKLAYSLRPVRYQTAVQGLATPQRTPSPSQAREKEPLITTVNRPEATLAIDHLLKNWQEL